MAKVINVQEFKEEGFAVVEDTQGKYLVTKHSDKIEVIPSVRHPYIPRNPCALVQPISRMMT